MVRRRRGGRKKDWIFRWSWKADHSGLARVYWHKHLGARGTCLSGVHWEHGHGWLYYSIGLPNGRNILKLYIVKRSSNWVYRLFTSMCIHSIVEYWLTCWSSIHIKDLQQVNWNPPNTLSCQKSSTWQAHRLSPVEQPMSMVYLICDFLLVDEIRVLLIWLASPAISCLPDSP